MTVILPRMMILTISLEAACLMGSMVPSALAWDEGGSPGAYHYDAVPARELMALVEHRTVMDWWTQFTAKPNARFPGELRSIRRLADSGARRVTYEFIFQRDDHDGKVAMRKEFTVSMIRDPSTGKYVVLSVVGDWGGEWRRHVGPVVVPPPNGE